MRSELTDVNGVSSGACSWLIHVLGGESPLTAQYIVYSQRATSASASISAGPPGGWKRLMYQKPGAPRVFERRDTKVGLSGALGRRRSGQERVPELVSTEVWRAVP